MKLLLDEMLTPAIAHALVDRGYDVVAVSDQRELRSLDDATIFDHAERDGRAVVTEDVGGFMTLDALTRAEGRNHFGLILTASTTFPRHTQGFVGALTSALTMFLSSHPEDEASSGVWWLKPD